MFCSAFDFLDGSVISEYPGPSFCEEVKDAIEPFRVRFILRAFGSDKCDNQEEYQRE